MMKKNSSIARWICLTLVVAMACVMVPTLAAAAPPVTAPAGTCSFATPCSVSSQLTDAQSCILSTELSRIASTPSDLALTTFSSLIPLYRGDYGGHHDRCRRARHHCWERCNDSRHPHRCMERCMDNRGCR